MPKGRTARRRSTHSPSSIQALEPRTLLDSTLLKDINTQTLDSSPGEMAVVGQTLFFTANNSEHGRELWKTDGTEAGTTLVKDINLGAGYSWPAHFADFSGTLLFNANEESGAGIELWRSDGTAAGTYRIKDIIPGPLHSWPTDFTEVNGVVYFRTDVGFETNAPTASNDLWRTDGTEAGTFRVTRVGPVGSYITSLTEVGGTLYFRGPNPAIPGTYSLWKSDGTEAGTAPVSPHYFQNGLSYLTNVNGTLYFSGDSRLWKSDGTAAGTVRVTGANLGPGQVSHITAVGDTVYFSGDTQLWKSDGTAAGTTPVANIPSAYPQQMTYVGGALYFTAGNDRELYKVVPGVNGATRLLLDNASPRNVSNLTAVNGRLFFFATDPEAGRELWTTDGTPAGTVRVKDIIPGIASGIFSEPGYFPRSISFGGRLYFPATDPLAGLELWSSDGTDAGTQRVADIDPRTVSSIPQPGISVGGHTVYFSAQNNTVGWELYKSDGTPQGTALVKDINPGPADASPVPAREFAGKLIFTASDSSGGREPWGTDGTPDGTRRLANVNPFNASSDPRSFTPAGALLYFIATDQTDASTLWRTDGTPEGTSRVADFNPAGSDAVKILGAFGNRLVFTANAPGAGPELWITDGTPAGTMALQDIRPGPVGSDPANFAVVNGTAYFTADDGLTGRELWRTDGTPQGTRPVADITSGPNGSNPRTLFAHENALYFAANEQLWRSDGTAAGTLRLHDVPPGYPDANEIPFVNVGGTLLYVGTSPQYDQELWTTDGTPQGTRLVREIRPGPGGAGFAAFAVLDGVLYFVGNDGTTGSELWRSDGTTDGTFLVKDIAAGSFSPSLQNLTVINGSLYFVARDKDNKYNVWRSDGTRDGTVRIDDPASYKILGHANGRLLIDQVDPQVGLEPFAVPLAPDTTAPRITSARFAHETAPQKIILYFSEDVSASLQPSDLTLHNLTTNQPATYDATFIYDPINHAATWMLHSLPAGDYRATLQPNSVADGSGNPLDASAFTLNFFHLPADANRDRAVDFNDMVVLAQNYNQPVTTVARGDFTGDGAVNFEDLVLLAQAYNTTPPPPAPAQTVLQPSRNASLLGSTTNKPKRPITAANSFGTRPIHKPVRRVK